MSRNKKSRKLGTMMTVLERKPKKQELLADPTSKESRRKRAQEQRKKHQPVEVKRSRATQSAKDRDVQAGRKGTRHGGPLADKIRKINAEKREQEQTADE
jgi:hypothetical protein